MSAGVAPQHCGALGERANCQVVVSVHAASDTASCPLQWRPALDMLDTLAGWGIGPPVVVADAAYGTNAHLRAGLAQRGIDYMPAVRADVSAHPFDVHRMAPDRKGPPAAAPRRMRLISAAIVRARPGW